MLFFVMGVVPVLCMKRHKVWWYFSYIILLEACHFVLLWTI
jgi:hypothetical protein